MIALENENWRDASAKSLTAIEESGYTLRPEVIYSEDGTPFPVWRKVMPRIEDTYLDIVIYLYPSTETAKKGEAFGGTGFLLGVPFETHPSYEHRYAVTNSHVIREAKSTVIRLNTHSGDTRILATTEDNWVHHPDGDDIAVCYLGGLDSTQVKYRFVSTYNFLTKEIIERFKIGIGDDVFMVGRFSRHDGKQTNLPSARFGNISMMPYERIRHQRGYDVDSFLVETRSLSGYSGSPVFVYVNLAVKRPGMGVGLGQPLLIWLLGIDWGHLPIYEKVKERDRETNVSEGYVVPSNSGQMAVAPIWKLSEMLTEVDELVMARKEFEERMAKENQSPVTLDAEMPGEENTVISKESFEEALRRASRKVPETDEQKDAT